MNACLTGSRPKRSIRRMIEDFLKINYLLMPIHEKIEELTALRGCSDASWVQSTGVFGAELKRSACPPPLPPMVCERDENASELEVKLLDRNGRGDCFDIVLSSVRATAGPKYDEEPCSPSLTNGESSDYKLGDPGVLGIPAGRVCEAVPLPGNSTRAFDGCMALPSWLAPTQPSLEAPDVARGEYTLGT